MSSESSSNPNSELNDTASSEPVHVTEAHADALITHYERFFGPPSPMLIHERLSEGVHIDTYLFPPTENRPFITAATIGMSALPLGKEPLCEACRAKGIAPKHRAELLMYLNPDWDWEDVVGRYTMTMMAYVARYPHLEGHGFGFGITYEFPESIVPEGSLLTYGYVRKPVYENLDGEFEDFVNATLPDGELCHLYWLIPITRAECYIKRTQDPAALNEILTENEYFLFDVDRQCYVEHENRAQRRARAKAQRNRAKRRPRASVNNLTCMACGSHHD